MARLARWIRLGATDPRGVRAACEGFVAAQGCKAAPIVLWGCAGPLADGSIPEGERGYHFAVIAPVLVAPGIAARRVWWALSPAVAAYRDFGVRAYLDGSDIRVHGRRIGGARTEVSGRCVLITACLGLAPSMREAPAGKPEFRAWLREGLGLSVAEWGGAGDAPSERMLEAALRARFEAQHGWQFESSWPDARERRAISLPLPEFAR
jgi:hypothetical protein